MLCHGVTNAVKSHDKVCQTKECLQSASKLLKSMDLTVDPCNDFYKFTCGNWAEADPV